ncbi:lysylphosphatidylglycerol synthase transmembrane domain-containing protein [Modestobacter sp. VKM Ac-2984]|uniref:lysylphosphatidylglycerol synthase transmembrane domain-containing protein n=1 Tax=Modestobacter sp. VKM Ac-2984 TaxID=3004138 RepID=UPI0022AAFEBF|nr:YbhN family protein [Modestobacter sp. VKM Ac-2984]MCZ2816315.1 YbhN family protein [Modestobacter sp. VKM Ac-2984]
MTADQQGAPGDDRQRPGPTDPTDGDTSQPGGGRPTARAAATASPRRRLGRFAIVLTCLALAVWALTSVPWTDTWRVVSRAQWPWLLVAAAGTHQSAASWAVATRPLQPAHARVTHRKLLAVSYSSTAMTQALPGGSVVGAAYAVSRLRSWGASTGEALWITSMTALLSGVVLAAAGLVGLLSTGEGSAGTVLTGGVALLAVTALARPAATLSVLGAGVTRGIGAFQRLPGRASRAADAARGGWRRMLDQLLAQRLSPVAGAQAAAWTVATVLGGLLTLWGCSQAVGAELGPTLLLAAYLTVRATSLVQVTPGGLGVTDTALIAVLSAGGVDLATATALTLVHRGLTMGLNAVIGWTALAVARRPPGTAPAGAATG